MHVLCSCVEVMEIVDQAGGVHRYRVPFLVDIPNLQIEEVGSLFRERSPFDDQRMERGVSVKQAVTCCKR